MYVAICSNSTVAVVAVPLIYPLGMQQIYNLDISVVIIQHVIVYKTF